MKIPEYKYTDKLGDLINDALDEMCSLMKAHRITALRFNEPGCILVDIGDDLHRYVGTVEREVQGVYLIGNELVFRTVPEQEGVTYTNDVQTIVGALPEDIRREVCDWEHPEDYGMDHDWYTNIPSESEIWKLTSIIYLFDVFAVAYNDFLDTHVPKREICAELEKKSFKLVNRYGKVREVAAGEYIFHAVTNDRSIGRLSVCRGEEFDENTAILLLDDSLNIDNIGREEITGLEKFIFAR